MVTATEPATQSIEGEPLDMTTRLVVSPASGMFEPAALQHSTIHTGQIVGHVVSNSTRVAVTSPFSGTIESVLAWPQERLRQYQVVLEVGLVT